MMLNRIKDWFSERRTERARREQQEIEDFARSDEEARRRNEAEDPLQHDHPIDLSRQPPL